MILKKKKKVIKIGNGVGIIIPKIAEEMMQFELGDIVELEIDFKKDEIIIRKK